MLIVVEKLQNDNPDQLGVFNHLRLSILMLKSNICFLIYQKYGKYTLIGLGILSP